MSVLSQELIFSGAKDAPSSGWLIATGISLLIGTVFQEIARIDLRSSIEFIEKSTELLSIYLVL